jgi:hypothetical protein
MPFALAEEPSLAPIAALRPGRALPEGPGWFGSSWELHLGLEVQEGWPGDPVLNGWIETWLTLAAVADSR